MSSRRYSLLACAVSAALLVTACSKDKPGTPNGPSCSFTITLPASTFGPEGGTGSVAVTAGSGCPWTATSGASFVTITQGASGSGNGTVTFTVTANTGTERSAVLTVAGSTVTVTQRAAPAPPNATIAAPAPRSPVGGQTVEPGRPILTVDNAATTGNAGTVTYRFEVSDLNTFPDDAVRTFTQDGVAQGNGTTSWAVNHDLGPSVLWYWRARATNGTVTSAFSTVETFRTSAPCTITLSPTTLSPGGGGGTSTITVTASSTTCAWTAVSNAAFITIASAASGTGSGSVTITVAANTGGPRTGTVTIGGQTVTVNQGPGGGIVAGFQLFDPSSQVVATTECRFKGPASQPTTCVLRSNSLTLGTNVIVLYAWRVQYTYDIIKTIEQSGSSPEVSFSDVCGGTTSTEDGVAQPLAVTLTVTDNLGATATATAGSGSQPPLTVRLFKCGF